MFINWTKIFLLTVIILNDSNFGQSYLELFPKESEKANRFFVEYKEDFEKAGKNVGLSAEFLYAIVAPELSQYGYLSNKMETYALKVMYVQGGTAYANFSIGFFQMKPSFIEQLETFLVTKGYEELKKEFSHCLFIDSDSRQARVERVDRLNNIEWQMKYLTLFCAIVNKRFGAISFANEEERLRFYASAYNSGFHKTERQIKEMETKAFFPRVSTEKFNYSDVAVGFYNEVIIN